MWGRNQWENRSIPTNYWIYHCTVICILALGTAIEPLYFVQITGKGVAEDDISDLYGHFIATGEKYFQGLPEASSFKKSKDQTIFYPAN